ncbi:MAG TPA: nucleotidyltransferase domain-containing protein [archaeon]|nr:nucleotidyltransferase domain-containing protein [archaeon]
MEAWEKAVHKFLTPWKAKKYVIGALVTGSFVPGNATKHSDVDLHIILDCKVKWRERGNKMVDGFLIEYFANPPQQLKKCMEEGYRDGKRVDARMYLLGKIIFDRTGEVKKLQENAKKRI